MGGVDGTAAGGATGGAVGGGVGVGEVVGGAGGELTGAAVFGSFFLPFSFAKNGSGISYPAPGGVPAGPLGFGLSSERPDDEEPLPEIGRFGGGTAIA